MSEATNKNNFKPTECKSLVIGGISLGLNTDEGEACNIAAKEMERAGINPARLRFSIYKRSVDARKKKDIRLVYSVAVRVADENMTIPTSKLERISRYKVTPLCDEELEFHFGSETCDAPPLVVGMGPCGLFCALILAENGYRPVIIDRGDSIADRQRATRVFFETGVLDTESNIQFGAGGAGTFSDGKLLTRVNDARTNYVLRRFCDFGAPEDIMTNAKPHIGTDLLLGVVDRMIARIAALGGTVMYRTRLESIDEDASGVVAHTTAGDIRCSSLVLAVGHSARDTYAMLMKRGYLLEPKPFSLGARIEHLQSDIDKALFGDLAGHEKLGRGEYHLSDTTTGRGVYTFCMCPGGEVVAAASEEGGVVVNGMSRHARDGRNANSAILASVRPSDHGGTCESGIELQRSIERAAFLAGGSNYYAPVQTVGDFLDGKAQSEPSRIMPTYRDGKVTVSRIDKILPGYVTDEIRLGLRSFGRRMNAFAAHDAVLTGVETRSSSPVRIIRNEALCASGHDRIYPCGEGAGYAGGITSAALDGLRVGLALMERFAPYAK